MIKLSITDLQVNIGETEILKGISFAIDEPICVAIVGLSGSGKTMFARSLMGLLPSGSKTQGEYLIGDETFDLNSKEKAWRKVRGKAIGLIMQDPFTALDPLVKCGKQILAGVPKKSRDSFDVKASLAEVGLPDSVETRYPFELSGGQRQRVVIAAALATEPSLLIADEATTSLDVVTQQEIIDLIDGIRKRRKMPMILITHDIGLVCKWADRIVVVEDGRIVETGEALEVARNPKEEYTRMLVEADRLLSGTALAAPVAQENPVLVAKGLTKRFGNIQALDDVSFEVNAGECVGIVGESGSGKTTLARCLVGLEHPDKGEIKYHGKGNPQIVFQDPYSSLNPAHTVDAILKEALRAGGASVSLSVEDLLQLVELSPDFLDRKPARLSGGQRQRVALARSLAAGPDVLILDESVSALDVVVQNQILVTIDKLRRTTGLAIVLITHDLSVVRMIASRVYVMNNARVIESGDTNRIFAEPKDPYTIKLLAAAAYANINRAAVDEGDSEIILFKNARIYTVSGRDWDKSPAEAMVVSADGKILAVGSEAELAESGFTKEIDLGGQTVFPGFVDTHVHAPGSAFAERFGIYLYEERCLDGTLSLIENYIKEHADDSDYFGTGYYMSIFFDSIDSPRVLLDRIESTKPVTLESSDGHSLWLNTAALNRCGITAETKAPCGGKIGIDSETGELTGILTDSHTLVCKWPEYDHEQQVEAARYYQQKMLAWGHTTAMHIAPHFGDPKAILEVAKTGAWKMRVNFSSLAEPERPIEESLNELRSFEELFSPYGDLFKATSIKFFADGVVEGLTAYMKEPYEETASGTADYRGEPIWLTGQMKEDFKKVMSAGVQLVVHSIGDAATGETLDAIKNARAELNDIISGQEHRDVITHLHVVDEEDINLMKELDIIASYQPFWHFKEPFWYNEIEYGHLGEQRALAAYPVATMIKKGIPVTFSGDFPASPVNNPFWGIEIAVTRNLATPGPYGVDDIESMEDETWLRNPGERISVKEAVEAYTIAGAFQLFRENEVGSLEPGKQADFIVIDRDILTIDPIRIDSTEILAVYISGEKVFG